MRVDPIIKAVRDERQKHAESLGNDLTRIAEDVRQKRVLLDWPVAQATRKPFQKPRGKR